MARILIVEDDPMIAEIYQRKFGLAGFETSVATTGREVLIKAAKEKFDLILLDLILPEIGGLDVLKEIKQSGKYDSSVKVIIFSNLNEKNEQDKAFELGAEGFILKSQFNPSQLVEEVKRIINNFEETQKNNERRNGKVVENGVNRDGRKRILFIEDEDIFVEIFGKKLESEGYVVSIANSGSLGLEKAMKGRFDLIITDMVIPDMSGDELIVNLKKEEKTRNIPIIVLSASLEERELQKVKELGISEYYVKTRIIPSDLVRKIEEILK